MKAWITLLLAVMMYGCADQSRQADQVVPSANFEIAVHRGDYAEAVIIPYGVAFSFCIESVEQDQFISQDKTKVKFSEIGALKIKAAGCEDPWYVKASKAIGYAVSVPFLLLWGKITGGS